jgi:hypothetical protein
LVHGIGALSDGVQRVRVGALLFFRSSRIFLSAPHRTAVRAAMPQSKIHSEKTRRGRMNTRTIWRISASLFFVVILGIFVHLRGGLGIEPIAKAAAQNEDSFPLTCSSQTIRGSYGISTTGSILFGGPVGLVADVGVVTFDGNSGASQTSTVSLNGTIIHRSSLSGSYTVNPDCTGDLSLVLPAPTGTTTSTSQFVIVRNGEELQTIVTGAGRVLAGNAKRQHPRFW